MRQMRARTAAAALVLGQLAAQAGTDPALVPVPVAVEGVTATAVGLVTSVDNLAVNNLGQLLVECDTDNANTDTDGVLIDAAANVLYQEGQLLAAPPGAGLGTFDAVTLNNLGNSAWNFFLDNTTSGNDDSGIYFNASLLIQEGFISTAAGFAAGTPYVGFFEAKLNDLDRVLVMASVDDPLVASTVDRALVVLDAAGGVLAAETVVLKEGDPAPGTSEFVTDFGTGPHNFDFNNLGDVLFEADITGPTTQNSAIYRNTTLLAREGDPSPVAGRNWGSLSSPELSINNAGDVVFSVALSGDTTTDAVIVKNGAILRQEGDSLPDIAPFKLTSFGTGPVLISDAGDVLWFGDWDDPNTAQDTGLFLNDKLIVREGDVIGGNAITALRGIQDGYAMSDDGRYILFEAQFGTSTDVALRIDRGPWTKGPGAKPGSSGVAPRLLGSGTLTGGDNVSLCLDRGVPGATSFLVIGLNVVNLPFLGTILVPSPDVVVAGLPLNGAGGLLATAPWPVGVPGGIAFRFQWFVADAGVSFGFSASNSVTAVSP